MSDNKDKKDQNDIKNSIIVSSDNWVYGFTQVDNGVISHPELTIYDKMVYITIKSMINQKDHITYPSFETISKVAGCSRRKVIDVVDRLKELDLIQDMGRHVKYGSNVYMIKRIQESKVLSDPEKNLEFTEKKMGKQPEKPIKQEKEEKADSIPYKHIIDYLNMMAGTKYSHTGSANQKLIKARWNEMVKAGLDAFQITKEFDRVIDVKSSQWKDSDMAQYLRPSTLFGNKFDQYRNESPQQKKPFSEQSGQASAPGQKDWVKKFLEGDA